MSSTDVKQNSRKRLLPLLEARLNDRTIPQLCWVNKEEKTFRMPWRYHKSARWGDPDAFMLRELAKVMYHYNGPDVPTKKQLSEWKGWLRNNLKTLCDFEELPHLHVLDGDNPYRVYRFVSDKRKHGTEQTNKTAGECQGRRPQCRREDLPVATERSPEVILGVKSFLGVLDESVSRGCSLMLHAGVGPDGNTACDDVNMSSSQDSGRQEESPCVISSGTNGGNCHFNNLSQQDNLPFFDELFQNTDMDSHETSQFDVDVQNRIFGMEFREFRDHGNSSSQSMPVVNNSLDFLHDSSVQALSSISCLEPGFSGKATDGNVDVSGSRDSVYQQRIPEVARSCASEADDIIDRLLQVIDQDYLSQERFLNRKHVVSQQDNQFNTSSQRWDIFDSGSGELQAQTSSFRSRSPLTTDTIPHFGVSSFCTSSSCDLAISSSCTRSSCGTFLNNSPRGVSSNGPSQHGGPASCGLMYDNMTQEVASFFHEKNDVTKTKASRDTRFLPDFTETLVHSDLLTAVGTSSGMVGTSSGMVGTSSGVVGTSSGMVGTSSGMVGTSSGMVGTSSGMVGTSSGMVGTSSGMVGTSSGMVGTLSGMFDDLAISGFQRRTFLSLTRMISVRQLMPLGVEVSYYNSPAIQPRMMPPEFTICFVADGRGPHNFRSSLNKELTGPHNFRSSLNKELTGPQNAHLLELPAAQNCPRLSITQIKTTNKVLANLKDGIMVTYQNGHIYATRDCKAGVQFSVHGRADWQKLEHLTKLKILDYDDYKRCYSSPREAPIPQPFVRLCFAAKDARKKINVLTVDIWHMEALLLARQAEESASSLEPDLSLSNDFEEILRIGEMLSTSNTTANVNQSSQTPCR